MQRVACLVEVDGWEPKQIESCLDQLRMTNNDIDALLELFLIPQLATMRRNCLTKDSDAKTRLAQDPFKAPRHIVLAGERGVHLAAPTLTKLFSNILDELTFLRMDDLLRQLWSLRNEKRNQAALLRIQTLGPYLTDAKGMVRVKEQTMEDEAH